jgi:hypothetical protein
LNSLQSSTYCTECTGRQALPLAPTDCRGTTSAFRNQKPKFDPKTEAAFRPVNSFARPAGESSSGAGRARIFKLHRRNSNPQAGCRCRGGALPRQCRRVETEGPQTKMAEAAAHEQGMRCRSMTQHSDQRELTFSICLSCGCVFSTGSGGVGCVLQGGAPAIRARPQ